MQYMKNTNNPFLPLHSFGGAVFLGKNTEKVHFYLHISKKINKYLLYLRGHRHGKPSHLEATLASLCE